MKLLLALFYLFVIPCVWAESTPFVYDDHGKRDPLWSLVNASGNIISYETDLISTDLNLEGIMVGADGRSLAIINGKVLKENERIGQFSVLSISKDSVIISKEDQKFELKLKKEE